MRFRQVMGFVAAMAAGWFVGGPPSPRALAQTTERVSVSSSGAQGNNHSYGGYLSMSADGRFIAFSSLAANLVPRDTNDSFDVFVRDRQTGATERVSVSSSGAQGDGQSDLLSISADGRFVAFQSDASNIVPGDTNGLADILVHDRQTGATERVSVSSSGAQGNGDSYRPSISANGRFVAFYSDASNLVPDDTNGTGDVFVHDRQTGATDRVSVSSTGAQGNEQSYFLSISADGRFVAFDGFASNLAPGDTNGTRDVFVRDRQTGATERVSVSSSGAQGNSFSLFPSISADGRFVAFHSDANNLVTGDDSFDVFVHDRQTGATDRVSVSSTGAQGNEPSAFSSISADGRFVAFLSSASNLAPGDTNGYPDVFVRDREPGRVFTQPGCTPLTINAGVSKLVFLTHGCCTSETQWSMYWLSLKQEIESWIQQNAQWQVIAYDWTQHSSGGDYFSRAKEHGDCQGALLAEAAAQAGVDEIHFISHSAGCRLIDRAATQVKEHAAGAVPMMHSTFLDAYAGVNPFPPYGQDSDWAEQYFAKDGTGFLTARKLAHAHNVDVTLLDPCRTGPSQSSHGWPREFYRWTLTGTEPLLECSGVSMPGLSCADGYGWPLSLAALGVSWDPDALNTAYPVGQAAQVLSCGKATREVFDPPELVQRLDDPVDFLDVQSVGVTTSAGGVTLAANSAQIEAEPGASYGPEGNTAWFYFSLYLPETTNFVRYDAGFESAAAAEGLLSIYIGDEWLSADERFALPGMEEHFFQLPEEIGPGTVTLGFRLDAFGTGLSQATVSNVRTGYGGYVPGAFSLITPADGAMTETLMPTLEWEESFEARSYRLTIATDPGLAAVVHEQIGPGTTFDVPFQLLDGRDVYYWSVEATNVLGQEVAQPGVFSFTTPLLGDFDGDGVTGVFDFAIFAVNFTTSGHEPFTNGDLDGDGDVDVFDFGIFASAFAFVAPWAR